MENKRKYKLKELRVRNDLTREQIASKLGISKEHYGILERNPDMLKKTSVDNFLRLADILKVELDEIFLG